ncbi:MAG: hypothetical protein LC663_06035 [Actinobacteria bacterium]|nr:hypothetical protein [Actinomycetota bacterium]
MKRLLALVLAAIGLSFAACGGGSDSSAPTPAPTLVQHPKTRILQPAGRARDTVNQLNQEQQQEEQQTGGSTP